MDFIKKNIVYLSLTVAVAAFAFVPGVKRFVMGQIFPLEKVENEVMFSDKELDIKLKGINVPDANLKDFKGKVLFLNFWGTWCPPCREEWPAIQKLHDAKKAEVAFVLVAMQDKEGDVRRFLKEKKYTAPVYIAQSPLGEKMLPKAFPTTFIIGKNGQILQKKDYLYDWNSASVHQFLDAVAR